jgi:large subunit ribosomal protein L29
MKEFKEIKSSSREVLQSKLLDYRKEAFNLRFQRVHGQVTNTARVAYVRKMIARIKTLMNMESNKNA